MTIDQPVWVAVGLFVAYMAVVGLASLLLSRYDVLLLDEPTNNLDLAGLERLERIVLAARGGIVVVSHDREFLARTVTRVLELDLPQRTVRHYGGGYAAYLEERSVTRRHAVPSLNASTAPPPHVPTVPSNMAVTGA